MTDPDSFFSVDSIIFQDDEVFLTNIIITESIIINSIKELSSNSAVRPDRIHFLTGRTHFVRLQGGMSFDSHVISGVPQGTVLGPLLFIIFMCDSGITSSSMVSFADDTRLYYGISNVDDCAILQNDLNSIYEWAFGNNMLFNAQKFQYICFNPRTSLSCNVYTSSSLDIIDYSRHVLDLGIYVSSDCSFEFHITNLNKRTKHLTGWILRTFSN